MPPNPVQQANFLHQAVLQHGLHYRGMGGLDPQQMLLNMEMDRARRLREQEAAHALELEVQRLQELRRRLAELDEQPRGQVRQQAAPAIPARRARRHH
jgi:hypothetical protein